jgi:hypothetical protein
MAGPGHSCWWSVPTWILAHQSADADADADATAGARRRKARRGQRSTSGRGVTSGLALDINLTVTSVAPNADPTLGSAAAARPHDRARAALGCVS